jgi:hypothetical protein
MSPAPTHRRSALRTVPRAAAALLALLLSVLAGPRGANDERRAERLSSVAAQSAPICGPLAVVGVVHRPLSAPPVAEVPASASAGIGQSAIVIAAVRPLRTSPVAARAP